MKHFLFANRKRTVLFTFFCSLMMIGLSTTSLLAQVKEAARTENLVQRQIESYLSQILPPSSYIVTTSARFSVEQVTDEVRNEVNETVDNQEPVLDVLNRAQNQNQAQPPLPADFNLDGGLGLEDPLPGLEPVPLDLAPINKVPGLTGELNQVNPTPPSKQIEIPVKSDKSTKVTTTTTTYKDVPKLESVAVQIVLDEKLDQGLVATVKRVVSEKIDNSFEDLGTVTFTTGNLVDKNFKTEVPVELVKDFDYYLDKYSFLIYMFFAIFIFFVMLMIFFFFIWLFIRMLTKKQEEERRMLQQIRRMRNVTPPRQPQMFPPYPPGPPYPYGGQYGGQPPPYIANQDMIRNELPPVNMETKKKNSNINSSQRMIDDDEESGPIQEYEQEFLDRFVSDPLVARDFFINLDEPDQKELVGAFPNTSTRKIFNQLLNLDENKDSPLDRIPNLRERENKRQDIFKKNIKSFDQHKKILASQFKDVFGQISLLKPLEMDALFSTLDADAIAKSCQVVDSGKIMKYLERQPDRIKNEFVKAMQEDKPMSDIELNELKQLYKTRINEIARNIFIDKPDKKELQEKIFKTVENKKSFLEKIQKVDPEFYDKHRAYTIDFNDFLEQTNSEDPASFFRTIDDSDNDIIANAFANMPIEVREGTISELPDERRDFINQIMLPKIGQIEKEVEEEAREAILNKYRELVFR